MLDMLIKYKFHQYDLILIYIFFLLDLKPYKGQIIKMKEITDTFPVVVNNRTHYIHYAGTIDTLDNKITNSAYIRMYYSLTGNLIINA